MSEEYENYDDDYDDDFDFDYYVHETELAEEDRTQEFIFFGIISGFFNWLLGGK